MASRLVITLVSHGGGGYFVSVVTDTTSDPDAEWQLRRVSPANGDPALVTELAELVSSWLDWGALGVVSLVGDEWSPHLRRET